METFSALLAICAGNSPIPSEFPTPRPVKWSFDVFFDLRLNKRLSKHTWGWWFEMLSCPLWRKCNENTHNRQSLVPPPEGNSVSKYCRIGTPIIKIRQSYDCLLLKMGILNQPTWYYIRYVLSNKCNQCRSVTMNVSLVDIDGISILMT